MEKIEIFGRHTSYNVQKVLWLADELQIEYSHSQVGGKYGGNDTPNFLKMNPMGKVPVLRHGDKFIWESNTILRYLAECYSPGIWIASTAYEKSLDERWMDWSMEKLEPAFFGVFWGFYRTPPDERNNDAVLKSVGDCERCLEQIGNLLSDNEYLFGTNPRIADVALGTFLHRLLSIKLDIKFPENVLEWYVRLSDRPGYRKWVMSDFSELEGRTGF